MLPVVLLMASAHAVHPYGRNRRQTSEATVEYVGSFPGLIGSRRSIFADPRFQQGIEQNILRRYKHMEKLINFYDGSINNITRYWTYGCWCFQMGDYPLRTGSGSPVDNVDKACKRHKDCYACVKRDGSKSGSDKPGECNPETTGYGFEGSYDPVTGDPIVTCKNKEGSCRRNIFECDKAFASQLPGAAASSDGWNGGHHAHYGGFNQNANCLSRISTPGHNNHVQACCGTVPNRFPYRFAKNGSGKQCCNNVMYNADTHDCCDDGQVRTNGSC